MYTWLLSIYFIGITDAASQDIDTVQKALEYVYKIGNDNCGLGTGEVLPLQFDVTQWNRYTDPAIRTANFLSEIIERNGGTLDSLTDEAFFLLVRNNVHGDSLIFGSAIAIETGVYSKYEIFCPYAYKKNNSVYSHDIAINYNYLESQTEWYISVKNKTWDNITIVKDHIKYRSYNVSLPEAVEMYPVAGLQDGHWTNPYFDCGGGNIWMVTYSSPILLARNGTIYFKGVGTIDIEMTNIDINQCDDNDFDAVSALDVFRGTHRCQPTTQCVPVTGNGFVSGAYQCICKDGYYFPQTSAQVRAYSGKEIEDYFRRVGSVDSSLFRCVACATACETCMDASPCLFERNKALMVSLMLFNAVTVFAILCIAVVTYIYRREMVIKSASPIFLELMCLGAVCVYIQFFLSYPESSPTICSVRIWPIHLGFFIIYGSLIIKTWRISVIFTVGTHKRVRLPDQVLLQRFFMLVLLLIAVLAAWSGSQPPKVETLKTDKKLRFYICNFGNWGHALTGVEILLLLYGVYLCYTVRKAPEHFNESKHITWAIYNAIILGSFMSVLSRLFVSVIGPDLLLVVEFAQIQVYATVTTLIIFVPKVYLILLKKIQYVQNAAAKMTFLVPKSDHGLPLLQKLH